MCVRLCLVVRLTCTVEYFCSPSAEVFVAGYLEGVSVEVLDDGDVHGDGLWQLARHVDAEGQTQFARRADWHRARTDVHDPDRPVRVRSWSRRKKTQLKLGKAKKQKLAEEKSKKSRSVLKNFEKLVGEWLLKLVQQI